MDTGSFYCELVNANGIANIIEIVIAVTVTLCFLIYAVYVLRQVARKLPPYRKVVNRMPALDGGGGEILTLACGHLYRLTLHSRVEFPCEFCREQEQKGRR